MDDRSQNRVTLFARTNFRPGGEKASYGPRIFGIKDRDRLAHMYVIGKTGTGKSTLMATMMRQDIEAGQGFALLDPHGDLVELVLSWIPADRQKDLIYFNVPDTSQPLAFNPLEAVPTEKRPLVASGLLEAFKKIWGENFGPRSEHILRNCFLALLDQPEATLGDVLKLLDDKSFREEAVQRVENPQVRRFWLKEYKNYSPGMRAVATAPVQNKVGAFLSNPILHRILVQPKSSFDLRQIMDEGKILLVNLAKGKIGEDSAALLGALVMTRLGLAGLSRSNVPESDRRNFWIYADEFQTVTTFSLANMLSELRKYYLGMVLANQYLSQLDPRVRDAILGNAGTLSCFRVGAQDAGFLAREFDPLFDASDLINLPNFNVYLKLMIDGKPSKAFSAESLPLAPTT